MVSVSEWLPHLLVGLTFTGLGAAKVYGLARGIRGGGGRPACDRLCGSCPSWSRATNVGVTTLFLAIGLGNLMWLASILR